MRSIALCLLVACGAPTATPTPPSRPQPTEPAPMLVVDPTLPMETFTINGYLLAGAEYWPYVGDVDIRYPEEVLWGFYPEAGVTAPGETEPNLTSARPEALACARQAYDALRTFVATDPPKLREIIKLGELDGSIVPRFYLWTNDYGRASTPYPPGVREARLWWWKRKTPEPPKPPGYWKWESSLLQTGECTIPRAPQIDAYLDEMLGEMRARVRARARAR